MRKAETARKTNETDIHITLDLDGSGERSISSGVGFFDHMLEQLAKHGRMDITLSCEGDTHIDAHHTVEDVGIALGQTIAKALGDKRGIRRYGSMLLPMDEALVEAALDISGRPYLVFDADIQPCMIGGYDAQLTEEFFRALAVNAGLTLHITLRRGKNAHHIAEAMYKAVGRALAQACSIDPDESGIPSTKGVL